MVLTGLTGGIGMGKSTVAACLARRGEQVIDADVLARQVVEPGEPALAEIREAFGSHVFGADGRLNREALGRLVFQDEPARRQLERILHPRIRALWREQAAGWRAQGLERAFVVIPLLYETGAEAELDRVLCVACRWPVQQERLRARGWPDGEIRRRVDAQWPVGRKMDLADGVIWNESTVEICEEQCARLLSAG